MRGFLSPSLRIHHFRKPLHPDRRIGPQAVQLDCGPGKKMTDTEEGRGGRGGGGEGPGAEGAPRGPRRPAPRSSPRGLRPPPQEFFSPSSGPAMSPRIVCPYVPIAPVRLVLRGGGRWRPPSGNKSGGIWLSDRTRRVTKCPVQGTTHLPQCIRICFFFLQTSNFVYY